MRRTEWRGGQRRGRRGLWTRIISVSVHHDWRVVSVNGEDSNVLICAPRDAAGRGELLCVQTLARRQLEILCFRVIRPHLQLTVGVALKHLDLAI